MLPSFPTALLCCSKLARVLINAQRFRACAYTRGTKSFGPAMQIVLCDHSALGQSGSPVSQGPTPAISAERLRDFVYRTIIRATPLNEKDHGVVEFASPTGIVYFKTLFHRLDRDDYYRVVQHLTQVFIVWTQSILQCLAINSMPATINATCSLLRAGPCGHAE